MLTINNIEFKIKENSFIARLAALKLKASSVAIVIGKTIHLHNCSGESFLKDEQWVKHELCHIQQFKQYGFIRFIFLYLLESLKHGYYKNKFEMEARVSETV
ncbi:MAG: DUF4157 domain-containing protein [Ferruginibacter sp.]